MFILDKIVSKNSIKPLCTFLSFQRSYVLPSGLTRNSVFFRHVTRCPYIIDHGICVWNIISRILLVPYISLAIVRLHLAQYSAGNVTLHYGNTPM